MPLFRRNKPADDAEKPEKRENDEPVETAGEQAADEIPAAEAPQPEPVKPLEPQIPQQHEPPHQPQPSRFHTPEGFDFNRYFLAERRITLENVSYETQRPAVTSGQLRLAAKDTIVAQLLGNAGVKATYNRTLSFEPDGPFTVSVSFSVMLVFNPGTRGEIDWKTIDVAEEFKKNCPQLVQTMMTKSALLIAEITNANGTPILPFGAR
ncbi:MAG: hypothetical protein K6G29_04260 [Clostridiales bacterium]|nr:hypothetical protein [Clostridiales bacterium]